LTPGQVEELITRPVEFAVGGVGGISSMMSKSIQGLSVVKIKFKSGINIYLARQKVAERLTALAGQLPRGATPVMTPLISSTGDVLEMGLASSRLTPMQLRTIAEWTVKPALLAVPGVAKVALWGGQEKQFQIQVLPERLVKYSLSMEDVVRAARKATGLKGAGFIEGPNQRIPIAATGQSLTAKELAGTVLRYEDGTSVTLGDVADVLAAPAPPIGGGLINGKPGVVLKVSAQYGANTLEVTRGIEKAISELRPALSRQAITIYPDLFRAADFIRTALHNINRSLLLGALLVVIVLFLYLFNLRTAAISCAAIPLSLLSAVTIMEKMGLSLNTMTIGGLAIAIGEVVDDAIIDVENIFRRLRENRELPGPRRKKALRVVYDASVEVRSAVVYATFAVVLVFIPVLTMSGLAGKLFSPLGLAYILSILSSLAVALTVTPALSLIMLGKKELREADPPVMRWTKDRYEKIIYSVERHPKAVIASAAVFMAVAAAAVPFLRGEFLPKFIEGSVIVHVSAAPGTSLPETLRMGKRLAGGLLRLPYVESVSQHAGRAEAGEEARGTNASEFGLALRPLDKRQFERAKKQIGDIAGELPGVHTEIDTFLTERIDETISGYRAPFVVNIYGNDLNVLDQKALESARVLSGVPGLASLKLQAPPNSPELLATLRKPALRRWGLEPVQVLEDMDTAFAGKTVGQVVEGNRTFDVSVILAPGKRKSITDIGRLPVRNSAGTYVSLGQLAGLHETPARFAILHDGGRRVQTITCYVKGSVSAFAARAEKALASNVILPPGAYFGFAGTAKEQAKTTRDLLVHSAIAAFGIILLLSVVTENHRNLLLILLNLPFALSGGVFMALATGGLLSIGSLVGFVTIFGITLRNSVMLISHYEHLVRVEALDWGLETAVRGAKERLGPILMTASVTALGLLPLALGSGAPGREIEGPMAQIILGGLVTSTLLNLLVMPTLARRFGRFSKEAGR
nr:efflux RND transporter permease subunit [Nitrospiraceae bacterium]